MAKVNWENNISCRTLALTGKDGGFSTPCHSCRLDDQHKVLKTFLSPGCLSPQGKSNLTTPFIAIFLCTYGSSFHLDTTPYLEAWC